jgi:hypothetical protein
MIIIHPPGAVVLNQRRFGAIIWVLYTNNLVPESMIEYRRC